MCVKDVSEWDFKKFWILKWSTTLDIYCKWVGSRVDIGWYIINKIKHEKE